MSLIWNHQQHRGSSHERRSGRLPAPDLLCPNGFSDPAAIEKPQDPMSKSVSLLARRGGATAGGEAYTRREKSSG